MSHSILATTQKNTAGSKIIQSQDFLQGQQYQPYPITGPKECYVPVDMQLVQAYKACTMIDRETLGQITQLQLSVTHIACNLSSVQG